MKWYEWNSLEEFNAWHDVLCDQLGYPLTPTNQATNELDLTAEKTTKYTDVYQVGNKWIAQVEDGYAVNLTETELRLPKLIDRITDGS